MQIGDLSEYAYSSDLTHVDISDSQFRRNGASGSGGAVLLSVSAQQGFSGSRGIRARVSGGGFSGNVAGESGGAVAAVGNVSLEIAGAGFSGNVAATGDVRSQQF